MSPKFCSMNYSSKADEYNKQVHGIEKRNWWRGWFR
jgi:phosphomethylpyrimidine synthase